MPNKVFINYGFKAWIWLFIAYFRLWSALLRIRFFGFTWLKQRIEFRSGNQTVELHSQASTPEFLVLHEAVRLAARLHFLQADCLPKSLVLTSMLLARGYQARTVVGVSKTEGVFASHAWVEIFLEEAWSMISEPESVSQQFTRI